MNSFLWNQKLIKSFWKIIFINFIKTSFETASPEQTSHYHSRVIKVVHACTQSYPLTNNSLFYHKYMIPEDDPVLFMIDLLKNNSFHFFLFSFIIFLFFNICVCFLIYNFNITLLFVYDVIFLIFKNCDIYRHLLT